MCPLSTDGAILMLVFYVTGHEIIGFLFGKPPLKIGRSFLGLSEQKYGIYWYRFSLTNGTLW